MVLVFGFGCAVAETDFSGSEVVCPGSVAPSLACGDVSDVDAEVLEFATTGAETSESGWDGDEGFGTIDASEATEELLVSETGSGVLGTVVVVTMSFGEGFEGTVSFAKSFGGSSTAGESFNGAV